MPCGMLPRALRRASETISRRALPVMAAEAVLIDAQASRDAAGASRLGYVSYVPYVGYVVDHRRERVAPAPSSGRSIEGCRLRASWLMFLPQGLAIPSTLRLLRSLPLHAVYRDAPRRAVPKARYAPIAFFYLGQGADAAERSSPTPLV